MIISDRIAHMIESLIEESGGTIELKRNVMAEQLGCAPSQINYVIMSRFTPERGYLIESRRGGGGYIRIIRKPLSKNDLIAELILRIGNSLEEAECTSLLRTLIVADTINARDAAIISAALSAPSLAPISSPTERAAVRASMMKRLLPTLIQ